MRHEWSGDVDLDDGKVAKLHDEYMTRRKCVDDIGIKERKGRLVLLSDLHKLKRDLESDVIFLTSSKSNTARAGILIHRANLDLY